MTEKTDNANALARIAPIMHSDMTTDACNSKVTNARIAAAGPLSAPQIAAQTGGNLLDFSKEE